MRRGVCPRGAMEAGQRRGRELRCGGVGGALLKRR
jgi:hypothetical protein